MIFAVKIYNILINISIYGVIYWVPWIDILTYMTLQVLVLVLVLVLGQGQGQGQNLDLDQLPFHPNLAISPKRVIENVT